MSPITTHVLDTITGTPAVDMIVRLDRRDDDTWRTLAAGRTDDDGRHRELLAPGALEPGIFRMVFETGEWFKRRRARCFYPLVEITFEVVDTSQHFHIPLLLSPFGFSTYRGS